MALTLELSPQLEERISREAEKTGLSPEDYACRLIESGIPDGNVDFGWPTMGEDGMTFLASEPTIAKIWDTPEEDEAWQHLQGAR